jgi:hypothetical protein
MENGILCAGSAEAENSSATSSKSLLLCRPVVYQVLWLGFATKGIFHFGIFVTIPTVAKAVC